LTEHNRYVRAAGFEVLIHASELRQITYLAHYDNDLNRGNLRSGWAAVLNTARSPLIDANQNPLRSAELALSWEHNWSELDSSDAAVQAIDTATLKTLTELD